MALIEATVAATIKAAMLSHPGSNVVPGAELDAHCAGVAAGIIAVLTTQTTLVPALVAPTGGGPCAGTVVIT